MKIDTRLTKTHVATFTPDDITSVAVSAVRSNLGITDDGVVVSSEAKVGPDGSVTVEIVEAVADAAAASPGPAATAPTIAPGIVIPTGLGGATAA